MVCWCAEFDCDWVGVVDGCVKFLDLVCVVLWCCGVFVQYDLVGDEGAHCCFVLVCIDSFDQ